MFIVDGARLVISPEGRSHCIGGAATCSRNWLITVSPMGRAEPQLSVSGNEGTDDAGAGPVIEGFKEGVVPKLDGMEVFQVPPPVASLLRVGVVGDCVAGGKEASHEIT